MRTNWRKNFYLLTDSNSIVVSARSAAIRGAGITPETIFICVGYVPVPIRQSDITDGTIECGLDAAVLMPAADAFAGEVGAVVKIFRMFFIRFPKGTIRRLHGRQFNRWICVEVVTNHRAVHRVAGDLLRALAKGGGGGIIHWAKIKVGV